jgi:hypothetical protein
MTNTTQKISQSLSRGIPFDELMQSQSNVRAELAANDTETSNLEIPVGGRRFQVLSLLMKQKRLAETSLIPCIVRDTGFTTLAEDNSLAENLHRVTLHPLEQFRAFVSPRDKGQSDEEIATAFFMTPQIVKQRLKQASATPALLEVALDLLHANDTPIRVLGHSRPNIERDISYQPADVRHAAHQKLSQPKVTAFFAWYEKQAYLTDILDRIHNHKINRLDELLPWHWVPLPAAHSEAA